ncbi:unnamed protein product [Rhizoctonia solani]|uniref:T6SS Phospholipase effector Tle1-like catalytic domain-containing protein n=1 Tax=Rhizoctonia solani TaxID=456999 RepID=A0A8H3GAH4_9AGAM|nr:unnamed protein product [Rhizoctonia solani]
MPHTLSAIRELPNCELYQLKLVRVESPITIVAVLTQKALDIGVRFDNDRKDYPFNLSEFLGNDDGKWTTQGANFETVGGAGHLETLARNISLDLTDRKNRCLVADLRNADKDYNIGVKYNLDKNPGLVDYIHPNERETYFRLGANVPNTSARTLVLCFDGTSNHFSNQNTNVVKFFELLKKDDPARQMVYYQTIGHRWVQIPDGNIPRWGSDLYIWLFAWCLHGSCAGWDAALRWTAATPQQHAPFAYQIYASQTPETISKLATAGVPNTSNPGTPSEDALTEELKPEDIEPDTVAPEDVAPSNAQLVGNPPDVPPPNNSRKSAIPEIKSYGGLGRGGSSDAKDTDPEAYKQTFCTSIMIDFVGVWDTVGSVGMYDTVACEYTKTNSAHQSQVQSSRARYNISIKTPVFGSLARVLESRPAQPDLSMHKATIKQARLESVERTQAALAEAMQAAQEHRRRLYEYSSKLDKIDIKHTPFEAVGVFSPWKMLELFPSTRPAQTDKGPEMTHWLTLSLINTLRLLTLEPICRPNLGKTRIIYRRSPTEPVFIHASVIDFLLSEKGKGYVPSAYWYGFNEGEFPRIESFEGNRMDWPDDENTREGLKSVMKIDRVPALGVLDRFKRWAGW